jgi:hypothetical protein
MVYDNMQVYTFMVCMSGPTMMDHVAELLINMQMIFRLGEVQNQLSFLELN